MFLNQTTRRPDFREGLEVRLSDGALWTLPARNPSREDPEFETLVEAALQAEDLSEQRLGELALTILLLTRNYDLSPDQLSALLSFPQDDPRLIALQEAVHGLVIESSGRVQPAVTPPPPQTDAPRLFPFDLGTTWLRRFFTFGFSRTP